MALGPEREHCDGLEYTDAIDELGRRAALGLMCGCTNSFSSTAREGHIEVSVPDYEAPVIYMDRQVKEAKEGFQQAQMLAFMQRMVVAPKCGEDRMISGIKYAAQVRAYRAATIVPVTDEYRQDLMLSQRSRLQDVAGSEDVSDPHVAFADKGTYREAPTKDEDGHSETMDQGRKSVGEGETSNKEDIFLFKSAVECRFDIINSNKMLSLIYLIAPPIEIITAVSVYLSILFCH